MDVSKFNLFNQVLNIKDADARNSIETINEHLTENDKSLNEIIARQKRKYILVGDSYGLRPFDGTSWTELFASAVGSGNCYHKSVGGAGFARTGNTFEMVLSQIGETVPNKLEITDIVVAGGYNDNYYEGGVIVDAIKQFFTVCKRDYPFAKVWVAFVGTNNKDFDVYAKLKTVYEAYGASVADNGGAFIDGIGILHCNNFLESDGVHPNQTGSTYLGRFVLGKVLGGQGKIITGTGTFDLRSNDTYAWGKVTLSQILDGNMLSVVNDGSCSIKVAEDNLPSSGELNIGLLPPTFSFFYGNVSGKDKSIIPFHAVVGFKNGTVSYLPCWMRFNWSDKSASIKVYNATSAVNVVNIYQISYAMNVFNA